jgi:hypothetical protein
MSFRYSVVTRIMAASSLFLIHIQNSAPPPLSQTSHLYQTKLSCFVADVSLRFKELRVHASELSI